MFRIDACWILPMQSSASDLSAFFASDPPRDASGLGNLLVLSASRLHTVMLWTAAGLGLVLGAIMLGSANDWGELSSRAPGAGVVMAMIGGPFLLLRARARYAISRRLDRKLELRRESGPRHYGPS